MPTISKTADSAWTTWSAAATNTTDGVVDATANPTTAFTIVSTSVFLSSLRIESTFNPSGNTLAVTGGSGYSAALSSYNTPSGYTLYLAPSKTASFNYIGFNDTYTINHVVYVDSNARLNTNAQRVGATVTANVTKSGPGTWRISSTENSSLAATSNLTSITIAEGTLLTESGTANPFGTTNTLRFDGGTLQVGVTRSFGNFTSVLAGGGTISPNAGVTATFTNSPAGTGTLTIGGAGNVAWNNNIARSLVVNGLLTMGSGNNLSGSTLSGGGTVAMNSGTLSSNAPSFTGNVSGNFTYSGTGKTFAGQVLNTVSIANGADVTFTRSSHAGFLDNMGPNATVTIYGTFATGDYADVQNGTTLNMVGPNANFTTALVSVWDLATLTVTGGTAATCAVLANWRAGGTGDANIVSDDIATNRLTGGWYIDGTVGNVNVSCKSNGTLELSGQLNSDSVVGTRPYYINNRTGAYEGTVKVTGVGFAGAAPVKVKKGKLVLERAGTIGLGSTGLTIDAGATLSCAKSNAAYAAQLTGNLTLSAGSIMKFGTA